MRIWMKYFFWNFSSKRKAQWMKTWRLIPSAKLGYCAKEMRIKGLFYPLYSNLSGERTWCGDVGHNEACPPSLDTGQWSVAKMCKLLHQSSWDRAVWSWKRSFVFTNMEKTSTRASSRLKVPTSTFTFKGQVAVTNLCIGWSPNFVSTYHGLTST